MFALNRNVNHSAVICILQVHIDMNGDAEGNYSVISLQSDSNGLNKANSLAKMSMQPVGYFVFNKQSIIPVSAYPMDGWTDGVFPTAYPTNQTNIAKQWQYIRTILIKIFMYIIILYSVFFFEGISLRQTRSSHPMAKRTSTIVRTAVRFPWRAMPQATTRLALYDLGFIFRIICCHCCRIPN